MGTLRVGIIGLGFAGKRMLACLDHIRKTAGDVELAGICDIKPPPPPGDRVPFYSSVEPLLKNGKPDVVVVATNDQNHEAVFEKLKGTKIDIISEKPLTSSLESCLALEPILAGRKVFVNYVERLSPIVREALDFLQAHRITLERGTFFWGKNRYADPRPTMGVFSDLTHPLDLLCHMLVPSASTLRVDRCAQSRYGSPPIQRVDSIDLTCMFGTVYFDGHVSFLWDGRDRRIILYGRSTATGRRYQILMRFDHPKWDCDALTINSVDAHGAPEQVFSSSHPDEGYISILTERNKVLRFLQDALSAVRSGKKPTTLCDYREAKRNMRELDRVMRQCCGKAGGLNQEPAPARSKGGP